MKIQEINAYLVLFHDDKILLLKRPNGFWEFPGGGLDWGEEPQSCALRETFEETGLRAENPSFLTVTSATYKKDGNDKHSVYIVYRGTAKGNEVKLTGEHTEFRWLTVTEAKYMKMALNAEPVLGLLG